MPTIKAVCESVFQTIDEKYQRFNELDNLVIDKYNYLVNWGKNRWNTSKFSKWYLDEVNNYINWLDYFDDSAKWYMDVLTIVRKNIYTDYKNADNVDVDLFNEYLDKIYPRFDLMDEILNLVYVFMENYDIVMKNETDSPINTLWKLSEQINDVTDQIKNNDDGFWKE